MSLDPFECKEDVAKQATWRWDPSQAEPRFVKAKRALAEEVVRLPRVLVVDGKV